jgi:hypothetical protein
MHLQQQGLLCRNTSQGIRREQIAQEKGISPLSQATANIIAANLLFTAQLIIHNILKYWVENAVARQSALCCSH